jgi:adenylate cyclase
VRFLFGEYMLDTDRRELTRRADEIALGPQVFDVLAYLVQHRNRVVSKDDLLDAVWQGRIVSESTLTSHINAVRKAIGDSGAVQKLIRTVARKGFRFVGDVIEAPSAAPAMEAPAAREPDGGTPGVRPPDKPSIAVLPFENLSEHPDYFADGIVEDVITELSRFSELFVIARHSSFQYKGKSVDLRQVGRELGVRYVLEGSIRRSGERVRVTGQLIDATTGMHRWAERYDRALYDLFAIQDEIARTIAVILSAHINKAEAERTLLKPPARWEAHDYFLRGNAALASFVSRFVLDDLNAARELLQRSIGLDPHYARAYAVLASSYIGAYLTSVNEEYQSGAALQRAFELAHKAVALEPTLPLAHAQLADALLFRRDYDASLAAWGKVFELNPNFTDFRYGQALIFAGQFGAGLAAIERHMRLDPFSPPAAYIFLGLAYLAQKRFAEAILPFQEVIARAPQLARGRMLLATTLALMGRMDEAHAQIAELLRIEPDCTVSKIARPRFFRSPADVAHILQGLQLAGLPL